MNPRRFSDWLRGENSKWLMRYPAMTVMVFLRRDIGYRLLAPIPMIVMTGILMIVAAIIPPENQEAHPEFLFWFAMLSLFLSSCQRTKRWREFKKGVLQHTYYIGTSPFDYRWLPQFCRRFRRMGRIADPFFCIFAGLVFLPESTALGFWLMIAGAALRIFEDVVFQKELNRELTTGPFTSPFSIASSFPKFTAPPLKTLTTPLRILRSHPLTPCLPA